jgi:hypothetical protein
MGTVPTIKKLTYSWEKLKIIKLSQIKLCDKYNIRNKQDTVKKKANVEMQTHFSLYFPG